ncbi:MAG: hypothetical protein WCK49_03345 [Myxococcaceae bacterium]
MKSIILLLLFALQINAGIFNFDFFEIRQDLKNLINHTAFKLGTAKSKRSNLSEDRIAERQNLFQKIRFFEEVLKIIEALPKTPEKT